MNKIRLLDCTLRDGGYCNQWKFGNRSIHSIINGLLEANIDIIECGFITQKYEPDKDRTQFGSFEDIATVLPSDREGKIFVAMINYGEFPIEAIPAYDGNSVEGVRVAFHKKDRTHAIEYCKKIKDKGYKVFVQGMVTLSYSDEEFVDLIKSVNEFEPFAFYIVDSFGMMKNRDLIRLFYTVEHNLYKKILIGFHSHNNMQLAYSNALSLTQVQTNREIIIDSTIYGMGRGAGNLNTELFTEFLNDNFNGKYVLQPLLNIIDNILDRFYRENYWGYSLPNYLAAKNNAHPNYAGYLDDKKTLTVEDMENIFQLMDDDKKVEYDKNYIEELYIQYLATGKTQEEHKDELQRQLNGKKVLLIAPGKSSIEEQQKIAMYDREAIRISVNFDYPDSNYIFLSNLRRFRELDSNLYCKCIVTSNITSNKVYLQTKYRDLLNDVDMVRDNAGLMAIKFLLDYNISEIALAGFDGYSHDTKENYANTNMEFITRNVVLDAMNEGMAIMIKRYSNDIKIEFLTTPRHINI